MVEKVEALLLGRRWRRDEHAWGVWQNIEPLVDASLPGEWERKWLAGRVVRVHQRARRGTKALVYFGSTLGTQDTGWPFMRPPKKKWVVVEAHLWLPPGTHSGRQVLWIDRWESWAPADTQIRALRHQRKMEKDQNRAALLPPP